MSVSSNSSSFWLFQISFPHSLAWLHLNSSSVTLTFPEFLPLFLFFPPFSFLFLLPHSSCPLHIPITPLWWFLNIHWHFPPFLLLLLFIPLLFFLPFLIQWSLLLLFSFLLCLFFFTFFLISVVLISTQFSSFAWFKFIITMITMLFLFLKVLQFLPLLFLFSPFFFLLFLFFLFSFSSYPSMKISSIFLVISWERCSLLPHFIHPCCYQQ